MAMTSSIKQSNSKTSLSWQRLLLAAIVLIGLSGTQASPITDPRWKRPCGGGETVEVDRTAAAAAASSGQTSGSAGSEQSDLRSIQTSASSLTNLVNNLKQKYMRHNRFVNENEAQIILRTYPGPHLPNLLSSTLTASQTDIILMAAYDSLARLSLYIELAKRGEENAENQRHSMETDYEGIENNPTSGLYTLMCHIKRAMISRGINLSQNAETEIRNLRATGSTNRSTHNSVRHAEDYVTLNVLQQLLNDLVTCISRLRLSSASNQRL